MENTYERYERLKHEWSAAHPSASEQEYQAAVAAIAKELGL